MVLSIFVYKEEAQDKNLRYQSRTCQPSRQIAIFSSYKVVSRITCTVFFSCHLEH
jgi:hypothetical protein